MKKTVGLIGKPGGAALLALAASLPQPVGANAELARIIGKLNREPRPTGNPTPMSIARRKARNTKRLCNKANGGFVRHPAIQTRADNVRPSTRGERRREKLGRV